MLGDLTPNEGGPDPLAGLRSLQRARPTQPVRGYPRLFVSHRQTDAKAALRIAYLACTAGFNYWLDILDPKLAALGASGAGTPYQLAIATAAVIEMALLNCTHVIAVITDNTPGTLWVPYEYGRVKDSALISVKAAAWFDPKRKHTQIAEYMHLGVQHHSEKGINRWLQHEMTAWPSAAPPTQCQWKPHPVPPAI